MMKSVLIPLIYKVSLRENIINYLAITDQKYVSVGEKTPTNQCSAELQPYSLNLLRCQTRDTVVLFGPNLGVQIENIFMRCFVLSIICIFG